MKRVTINKNDAGQRLDKFLFKFFASIPASMVYKGIRKKRIKVNGKKSEIGYMLCEGDVLELYINDEFFESPKGDEAFKTLVPKLSVVYEDDNILLADKASGISVHDDETEKVNTLINHIKAYLFQKGEYNPDEENSFAPALCNRIDRNTSGIVIAAKNAVALRIMNEKIKNREIEKFYLCLVQGRLKDKEKTLKSYMVKNEAQNRVYVHDSPIDGGKTAITRYRVLAEGELTSLLEVELMTGRTHQIRAHLASIGHPLAGDGKYGTNEFNKKIGMKHQALYSYKLKFKFSDENELSYLNGKSFEVKEVPFASHIK
ncbi:MAG: RluA family pseudouridine synthase [Clostridia bacterium]|nr:RluA family pseudouridine synthase [Clostridia bacterium]